MLPCSPTGRGCYGGGFASDNVRSAIHLQAFYRKWKTTDPKLHVTWGRYKNGACDWLGFLGWGKAGVSQVCLV